MEMMNILQSVKRELKFVGCLPVNPTNVPFWFKKIPINYIHVGLIFLFLILYLLSGLYFFTLEAKTIIDFSETLFWTSRSVLALVLYFEFIRNKTKMIQFIDDLEQIVNNRMRKNPVSCEIYGKTNEKSKYIRKYIRIFLFEIAPIVYAAPIMFNSYYKYFITNYSADSFQLLYPTALPFNWKSPIGYLFAVAFQLITFLGVLEIFLVFVCIYFGFCQFFVAFADDIIERIRDVNETIKNYHGNYSLEPDSELYRKLSDVVAFHSDVTQFVSKFSTFYKKFISMFFFISAFYLCIFFLRMQADVYCGDFLNIFRSLIRISGWISGYFFICRFGDQVTLRFQDIGKSMIEISHHELSPKMVELSSIMIEVAEKPLYLYGCFNARCIRGTFQKMLFTAFSFFIVLREII